MLTSKEQANKQTDGSKTETTYFSGYSRELVNKSKEWQTPKKKKKRSKVEGPKGEETLPEDANEEDLIFPSFPTFPSWVMDNCFFTLLQTHPLNILLTWED